ncbi:PREDICTED: uncharacterized protein LOC108610796 isoform X4 [Drosophila arizonae]|uniref:Uncharacterized protein LOC108610796 isoform X4 n=1 Tax=Drosophila arizonae TaxID=7263 RepID=A0ABM1NUG3_DROAR|nr:PREDICTED: uncharacterized protein LOC108610796 isoform X4 [Drosophila arizonae]
MLRRQRRLQPDNRCNRSYRSYRSCSSSGGHTWRSRNYLPGLLIVLLVLLQSFELHMCRQMRGVTAHKRHVDTDKDVDMDVDEEVEKEPQLPPLEKRAIAPTTVSQPEEIFSAPNDAADMSYDEYPMVVPKRAALLLDRLMVALHHALENEREGHRIGEFYANKNLGPVKPSDYRNALQQQQQQHFHMYSDDDPGVMMDYDFKDLNQINRATGETLMAKSFQRRAGTTAVGIDAASAAAAGPGAGPGPGPGASPGLRRIHHVANGGGRMYWRCYFNAVSCF